MKTLKFITASIVLIALATGMEVSAHPHGGGGHWNGGGHWHGHDGHWHGHVGLFFGVPLGAPWYPYYPSVVTVQSPQPVYYVKQNPALPAAPLPSGWWYYCANPAGYYPYVQSCAQPWQPVEPRSPHAR